MLSKSIVVPLIAALAVGAAPAHALGDAEAGRAKSTACAICHGADGKALVPMYPKLAGQNAAYLKYALAAYRSGERQGAMAGLMYPNAKDLTDQDIDDLAAYYRSLAP
ncbi:MAG: c-type cytochrome [Burkholderiales bacterium]|jgi:cytochrome c553|nr:c-type cytochrome [Burkholderiales bacterium]